MPWFDQFTHLLARAAEDQRLEAAVHPSATRLMERFRVHALNEGMSPELERLSWCAAEEMAVELYGDEVANLPIEHMAYIGLLFQLGWQVRALYDSGWLQVPKVEAIHVVASE